jgi:hypothetical protein
MTVYIHIGLHKTGSTSLQGFLRMNEELLAERGWLIPRAGRGKGKGANQHNLAWNLADRPRYREDVGGLQEVAEEVARAPNTIISAEGLEYLVDDQIQRLRDAFGDRDYKIIAYLRRQDGLIASRYWQAVQTGRSVPPIGAYVAEMIGTDQLDFEVILGRWQRVFGADSLRIAVVSRETEGDLLFQDFLAQLDLGGLEGTQIPAANRNASPSALAIEVVRRLNDRIRHGKDSRKRMMRQLQKALAEEETVPKGKLKITGADYAAVAERFARGNDVIANRYITSATQRQALEYGKVEAGVNLADYEDRIESIVEEFAVRV